MTTAAMIIRAMDARDVVERLADAWGAPIDPTRMAGTPRVPMQCLDCGARSRRSKCDPCFRAYQTRKKAEYAKRKRDA
jgi:hypothetical protein